MQDKVFTSYKGRFLTKNSSVALAVPGEVRIVEYYLIKYGHTEAIERSTSNHKGITLSFRNGFPALGGYLIGSN